MTKTILVGCAVAALMTGAAFAQGRGQGVGGGLGAGAGIGAGGMGVGAGASMGGNVRAEPPPIASGRSDTATTVRGASDVLPNTSASAQGVTRGSASTTNATQDRPATTANAQTGVGANASDRANDRRAATTDIRAGALVKNTSGATIGRIDSVTPGTGGAAATVTVRSGNDTWTLPQSELSASGDFLVTSHTRPAQ